MELNEYQAKAMTTCMPSCENFPYMMLNLVGEVGEFASKVAKHIRKEQMFITDRQQLAFDAGTISRDEAKDAKQELMLEAGDILWQLSGLCSVLGWKLEDVAECNLEKLASRKERGVIDGNGDNR